jgi:hypothetical protein
MEEKKELEGKKEAITDVSRREALRRGAVLGFSLTTWLANYVYHTDRGRISSSEKERYLAESPEGYKIGIITGVHEGPAPIPVTPIKEKDFYQPVGAFFLDLADNYLDPKLQKAIPDFVSLEAQKEGMFRYEPAKYALENKTPIIFGDLTLGDISDENLARIMGIPFYLSCLSNAIAGFSVSAEALSKRGPKRKLSRREFLKYTGTVGALATVHFSSNALVDIGRRLGLRPDSKTGRDFQAILSDISHPEEIVIVMRNIVWGLKCIDFYEKGLIPKDKIINVLGGRQHQFLDFFIRHPKVAKRYWQVFQYEKLAAELTGGKTDCVYKSYVFTPPDKGEVVIHESLKKLVA